MKQINVMMLCAAIMVAMCACGGTVETKNTEKSSSTEAPKTEQIVQDKVTKTGKLPVVIEFGATWCGWCKKMSAVIEEVSPQYKGKVDFKYVDVDEEKELAEKFDVNALPLLVFMDGEGNEVDRVEGYIPAEEFEAHINKLL